MVRFSKIGTLTVVVVLCGLLASSATAAEWHTNGDKAFTSTNAGFIRLALHTAGTTVVIIDCPSSTVSGTLNGPTSAATPWLNAATVTPVITSCTISGTQFFFVCSPVELRAISYTGGTTLATAGGGRTTGQLASIHCLLSRGVMGCLTFTGTVAAHYTNPNPIAVGAGSLTITSAGQSLTAHGLAGCSPSGTATIGRPTAGVGVDDITFSILGPNAPYIFRTP